MSRRKIVIVLTSSRHTEDIRMAYQLTTDGDCSGVGITQNIHRGSVIPCLLLDKAPRNVINCEWKATSYNPKNARRWAFDTNGNRTGFAPPRRSVHRLLIL